MIQTDKLSTAARFSLVTAVLQGLAALMGLLLPTLTYPTEELRRAFLANDVVTLLIGLPILLIAMYLAQCDNLVGLLFWPGALGYVFYNAIAYVVAMPLSLAGASNLALVLLSAYTITRLLSGMQAEAIRARLAGHIPARLCGGVLTGFGALFFVMAAAKVAGHFSGQTVLPWAEVAVQISDLCVTPTWVVGGILLWRKRPLGYITAAGLLFQASMLFIALLVFFLLQPLVAGTPFPVEDFVVIAVMSLVCLVPFGLLLRGIILAQKNNP